VEVEAIPFDVRKIVNGVVELMRPVAGRQGLTGAGEIDPNVPETIVGDPTRPALLRP
jgi:hypothetical protein